MARDKTLSDEDRILWGKVAKTTRALPGRMDQISDFFEASEAPGASQITPPSDQLKSQGLNKGPAVAPQKTRPGAHQPLEKPVKRKLSKGRLPLDARIDLHGMIQSEAHGLLLHFLMQAHHRGLRHVLVITGKGSSFGSDGVLKRAVPLWFSLPEFRMLISSFETAARNHGGDGALYVRLARIGSA